MTSRPQSLRAELAGTDDRPLRLEDGSSPQHTPIEEPAPSPTVRACIGLIVLLFPGPDGDYMRRPSTHAESGSWFAGAVRRSEVPRITLHDLRHTAASLAISAGANVKAVQPMLGHASAAMTLDTYSGLFEDDLDAVAHAMNAAATATPSA